MPAMQGSMPPDKWEKLAEVVLGAEPELQRRIVYLQTKPPDPVKQPVSSALAKAYLSRLEIELGAIHRGAEGLKDEYRNHPTLLQELQEIGTWILRKKATGKKTQLTATDEDVIGNWFVSTGRSYSETRQMLRRMRQFITGRGAPNKRPETLRMLDAKISKGLSYTQLASTMCDCGLSQHTEHCKERIRKRIRQLEKFLIKYNITYPPT
jgi:hypothetical protein